MTQVVLYTYHQYIVGFMLIGAFAHGTVIFFRISIWNKMRIIYSRIELFFFVIFILMYSID